MDFFYKQMFSNQSRQNAAWFKLRSVMIFPEETEKQGRAQIFFHAQNSPNTPLPTELNEYLCGLCISKKSLAKDMEDAQRRGFIAGHHLILLEREHAKTGKLASSEKAYQSLEKLDGAWGKKRKMESAWRSHYGVSHLWAALIVTLNNPPSKRDTLPTVLKLAQHYLPYLKQHLAETKPQRLKHHRNANSKDIGRIYWDSSELVERMVTMPPTVHTMLQIDPFLKELEGYIKDTQGISSNQ